MADEAEQEPSIEEILASIRQIISDDDEEGAEGVEGESADAVEDPAEPETDAPPETDDVPDDVIELTDPAEPDFDTAMAEADEAAQGDGLEDVFGETETETAPEPIPEDDTFDIEMRDTEDVGAESPIEPEPKAEPDFGVDLDEPVPDEPPQDALLTQKAESAAFDGFSELVRKTAVEHNGITIEEIVRTELRPLLSNWLDSHLPTMIERLVREELDRVAKRALGDE
ncbi:MAG: DUF2497 domain-containing protein [Bdellovibrionales bacterium]